MLIVTVQVVDRFISMTADPVVFSGMGTFQRNTIRDRDVKNGQVETTTLMVTCLAVIYRHGQGRLKLCCLSKKKPNGGGAAQTSYPWEAL